MDFDVAFEISKIIGGIKKPKLYRTSAGLNEHEGLVHPKFVKWMEEQRKEGTAPAELFPYSQDELRTITRTPSYLNEFIKYVSILTRQRKEINGVGKKISEQEMNFFPCIGARGRMIFYTLEDGNPEFMLNRKNSSRGYDFYELSIKGGIEIDDEGISNALIRESEEELPGLWEYLKYFKKEKKEIIKAKFYNWKDPQEKNSDLMLVKTNTDNIQAECLDIIITGMAEVKHKFYPNLQRGITEHDKTMWLSLKDAQSVLETGAKKTGMDRDYLLSLSLLPNVQFDNNNFFKDLETEIIGSYIKFP